MLPFSILVQLERDCTSLEATVEQASQARFDAKQKQRLHEVVCRLETIATNLRNIS